jgi:aspartyl-tRNA(Asn)/glutamyl-tRNA(Gln) amidotransferase subunit A
LLNYKNHSDKLEKILSGELSLSRNVKYFLNRIEEHKNINAFNFVFTNAVDEAEKVEKKIKENKAGKLAGMVVAIKDVLAIQDKPLTCSSNILKNFNSIYNATVVNNLIQEDAIVIGKTNCDEFAMGSSNENSAFGPVLNPVDKERVPGGSSGGSAAAVSAGLCDIALGTDTGGSIRQPAAFCGVFGLKPTYGLVSRYGLTAFASSFDTIGPFASNVEDLALALNVIAGIDKNDSTSIKIDVPDYKDNLELSQKFKIGIPKEYFDEGINEDIKNAIFEKINLLKDNGFEIIDIELPHTEYAIAAYYILTDAEASSNLARYDGVRYSEREIENVDIKNMYLSTRSQGFGKEVKRRIMLGTYVLSTGYYDAYYKKAQKVRRLIKKDFDKAFKNVDIILTPTTPTTAFKLGEKIEDPLQMYLGDIFTVPANLAGIPAINIPIGKDENGLPIGMQLMSNQFEEAKLFQLSSFIENMVEL